MTDRRVPPWIFLVLMIPFGAVSGYVSVTLGSQLGRADVSVQKIAELAALGTLPHTFKLLWSPVVDLTLSQKKWYLIAVLFTALGIASLGMFPASESSLGVFGVAVFLGSLASTVIGMSVETLMAHCVEENLKGQAGGWASAGNLGGSGIGGGLGLLMVERVEQAWMASCFIAFLCLLCALALRPIQSPVRSIDSGTISSRLREMRSDLWLTVRQRRGLLALILCFLPLGIGASSGLWSAIAMEWHAGTDLVAIVTGVLGGLVSAAGCILGGFMCDRWDRQKCYVWFGLAVSIVGTLFAFLPRTPAMFTLCTLAFNFWTGVSWAGYTAFVLEAIGKGAAATKFSAFASLANAPIAYMTVFVGMVQERWNTTAMLSFEALMGVAGAVVFIIVAKWLLPPRAERQSPPEPEPAPPGPLPAPVSPVPRDPVPPMTQSAHAEMEK